MTPFIENGESINDVGPDRDGDARDMGYPMPALRGARYTAIAPVRCSTPRPASGTTWPAGWAGGDVVVLLVAWPQRRPRGTL
jgi:hypothetical protein